MLRIQPVSTPWNDSRRAWTLSRRDNRALGDRTVYGCSLPVWLDIRLSPERLNGDCSCSYWSFFVGTHNGSAVSV
jgi:hypothetical protein